MSKKQIILDRTRLEQYAICPQQGYLAMIFDACKAKAQGLEQFPWEQERIKDADPDLVKEIESVALQSTTTEACETGVIIHELVKKAFQACQNDVEKIPEWLVENLLKTRPDLQPKIIEHSRNVTDVLVNYHINLIGCEQQLSVVFYPKTKTREAVIVTSALDMLGSGIDNIHIGDWKTGYKRYSNTVTKESFQAQFATWLVWMQPEYKEIDDVHFWYWQTYWGETGYAYFDRNEIPHHKLTDLTTFTIFQERIRSAVDLFLANCQDCWPLPDKCAYCDGIRFCKYANMDAKELVNNPAEYIKKLCVDEQSVSNRRKTVTEYVKEHGAIQGDKLKVQKKEPKQRFTIEFVETE